MKNAMSNAGLSCPDELTADGKLHRFTPPGDKAKSHNAWYIFFDDGDIQAGRFGSFKSGQNEKWCSKTASEFTPEEKKAYAAKMEAARRQREAEQAKIYEACRAWCKAAWGGAAPADSNHPYLVRKQVISYGLRQYKDSLMIPLMDPARVIHGIQFVQADGSKKFKTGSAKQGNFHIIGKPIDDTIIVTEGYATGASIHVATGHAVLIAFDAGNLKHVAEVFRKRRPDFKMIIAGDNDRWYRETQEGGTVIFHEVPIKINNVERVNTGMAKGLEAAQAVKAELVLPRFADLSTHPTDFNDLFILEGAEAVKKQVILPPIAEYQPPTEENDYMPEQADPEQFREHPLTNAPFQLLGYNQGEYFYLPRNAPQVVALKAPEHTTSNLLALAPLPWWEETHPAGKAKGFDATSAANSLIQANQGRVGVYDNKRIRGRGAWIEITKAKGDQPEVKKTVLHLGDGLIINGKKTDLSDHKSHWIYEAGGRLELDGAESAPMLNAEAAELLKLCRRFSWERPINAELLAGWSVIAPICGILPWRPHILITGAAGSGKSTLSDTVVRPIVGPSAIACMGNTTEAGLRGEAGSDARAVLFDEAEAGGEASKRMQAVIELARQSSSDIGYSILKGSQSGKSVKYQPRLCFCFSSIGAAATQQADNDRITTLSLVKDEKPGHEERWDLLKRDIAALLTAEYCQALRARGYSLIPELLANFKILSRLLGVKFSSQRTGDQYGAFLAGSYSLRSRNILTDAKAQEFIDSLSWDENITDTSSRDELQCLGVILQHQIRVESNISYTIGELLETAALLMHKDSDASRATLLRHGLRVNEPGDGFFIASKHTALAKILEKSPWSKNWNHILERIKGAQKTKPMNFTAGAYSRAVLLPMSILNTGGE